MNEVAVDTGGARLVCLVDGEPSAPLVVCAHGFPDGARTFRAQVPALVAAGYRVVAPFLRGYAPSSLARDGRYDVTALADDLCAVANHFSPTAPVTLVGHDWGALAAYAASARAPSRVARLCTIAVPHLRVAARRFLSPRQLARSWYMPLLAAPVVGERALLANGSALVDRLWRAWSPGYRAPADELACIKASFATRERARAVASYYRATRLSRWLLMGTTVPSLYLHGSDDGCVGVELADGVAAAYRGPITTRRLAGAGHFAHLERSDEVNAALLTLLRP
jgi:pimeloyl-ACP methyl ester carboxylesterase